MYPAAIACAQGGPAAETALPLSMKRAVEIALAADGSPRVALAEESIKQAEAQKNEARAALSAGYRIVGQRPAPDQQSARLRIQQFRVSVSAAGRHFPVDRGTLFTSSTPAPRRRRPCSISASIKRYQASKVNVEAAKSDFDATKNQVSDQVARAYLTALRADAALETAQANVDLSQALLKLAERQREAGTGTGIDVIRADVQLANDQQHLMVAENDRRRAGLNLLRAMGLNLDAIVDLPTSWLTSRRRRDARSALADARKKRAELKAQQERERSCAS